MSLLSRVSLGSSLSASFPSFPLSLSLSLWAVIVGSSEIQVRDEEAKRI